MMALKVIRTDFMGNTYLTGVSVLPSARLRPVGDYAPEGRAYASERKSWSCLAGLKLTAYPVSNRPTVTLQNPRFG